MAFHSSPSRSEMSKSCVNVGASPACAIRNVNRDDPHTRWLPCTAACRIIRKPFKCQCLGLHSQSGIYWGTYNPALGFLKTPQVIPMCSQSWEPMTSRCASQTVVPGPAAAAAESPWSLREMQVLRPLPGLLNQKLRVGPAISVF